MHRNGIRQAERVHARLAVAVRYAIVFQRHPLNPAGEIGRPGHRIGIGRVDLHDRGHFGLAEILVPAQLLQARQRELRIAILNLGILGIGLVGEKADLARGAVGQLLLALETKARPERTAAIHHGEVGVVEQRRARMFHLGRAPARPRQAIIVAADFRIVLGRTHSDQIELGLILHVRLDALRRLPAIAGRPAAAIDLTQNVLSLGQIVLDLDILEHLVGEAELPCDQIHDLEIVLGLEDGRDDLLTPLHRAIRSHARALAFELRGDREKVEIILAAGFNRE